MMSLTNAIILVRCYEKGWYKLKEGLKIDVLEECNNIGKMLDEMLRSLTKEGRKIMFSEKMINT